MYYKMNERFAQLFRNDIDLNGFEKAVAHFKDDYDSLITIGEALEREKDIDELYCPVCGRMASIRHNTVKEPCFVSRCHKVDCRLYLSRSKKKKTNNIVVGTYIDLKKAIKPIHKLTRRAQKYLNYKEGVFESLKSSGNKAPEINEEDQSLREITKNISTIHSIYKDLRDKDKNSRFGEGIKKETFFMDDDGLYYAKKKGIKPNEPKMAILKRVSPSSLENPFTFDDDYILLRDKFSTSDSTALFFLIRIINEDESTNTLENEAFQYYVRGHSKNGETIENFPKDTHDTILIMGNRWQEFSYNDYTVYSAEIYSDDTDFVNW